MKKSPAVSWFRWVILLLVCVGAHGETVNVVPSPAWVVEIPVKTPLKIPEDDIRGGIHYLLIDRQLKVNDADGQVVFHHYANYIVNQLGLESSSQLDVSFDPAYQSLSFHRIGIWRDGKFLDKSKTAKYSLLQREEDLEKLIYDGRLSANVILDDVRVGDIIDYSYSITGVNPVYKGIFSYSFYTQWSVPFDYQHVRVLWEKSTPLIIKQLNRASEQQSNIYGDGVEYIFENRDRSALLVNSQTPDWYDPYGQVFLTDTPEWKDIVSWALPLYLPASDPAKEISEIAERIRSEHKTVDAQIHAALVFVQAEIRYLGLEMGENSHKPSAANETLARRYGDCKDKTVLLISLLKSLGVSATPALVNTSAYREIANYPPAGTVFDHVIVHLEYQGKNWWIDPTRQHQKGNLTNIFQPDYGYALLIKEGVNELVPMTAARKSKQVVVDAFDLDQGMSERAGYVVTSKYYGEQGDHQRYSLADSSNTEVAEQYLNFYKKYYDGIAIKEPLKVVDSDDADFLSVTETYEISNIWEKDKDGDFVASFYANSVDSSLKKVDETRRNSPFELAYPHHVVQEIEIKLRDKNWTFEEDSFVEKNDFFYFRSSVKFDDSDNLLRLVYEYRSLSNHVPAEKIDTYIKAQKRAADNTSYEIYEFSEEPVVDSDIYFYLIAVLYALLVIFVLINWYRDSDRKLFYDVAVFYPISVVKVITLLFFTLGTYSCYWFYRNWSYIKRKDQRNISPFWRAVFESFWFYPIAYRIANSDEPKQQNMPRSAWILGVFAVLYFISALLMDKFILIGLALGSALLVILVRQVNAYQQSSAEIYSHHSRWKLRHFLLLIAFSPLFLLAFGQELRLLPADKVVAGDYLLQRDLKFMQRNNIIAANDKLIYFYSDDSFSIRSDGNGLTEQGVFSYWEGDDGELYRETAKFFEMQKIEFSKGSYGVNSILTVYREDGSDFLLYLTTEESGDEEFEKELRKRWGDARLLHEKELAFSEDATVMKLELKAIKHGIEQIIHKALIKNDQASQRLLAELYSRGLMVQQNIHRAIYFYELAYRQGNMSSGADLAWHLAIMSHGSGALERAEEIATELLEKDGGARAREVLAAVYAANGEFARAIVEQQRAVALVDDKNKAIAKRRLSVYQASQPWTEVWSVDTVAGSEMLPLVRQAPHYPLAALQKKVEGNIVFQFDVMADGSVANIAVESEEPEGYFEAAGREALQKFIYIPQMSNGVAIDTKDVKNKFTFTLTD
ncbi:TonB family protein [Cellvibrio sp. PSBB006]|uniref:TonB family protein n=1 Tax=Cellvibrio sp. PSBB006 TaxID=1987723 RepID=UPI000B3BA7A5|nr:TonB family protein [Cellvibrio sp. PSBB006]ARU29372.1 hypothetical protein CBR65_19100 [Cellvibrio sp. PSBB006]